MIRRTTARFRHPRVAVDGGYWAEKASSAGRWQRPFFTSWRRCLYAGTAVVVGGATVAATALGAFESPLPRVPQVQCAAVPINSGGGARNNSNSGTRANDVADDGLCSLVFTSPPEALASALTSTVRQQSINAVGAAGITPLMLAAYAGNVDAVRILLDAGADSDIESKLTRSVTHWRTYIPNYNPVGAGFRAFDFAILGGNPDAIALLVERGRTDPTTPRVVNSGNRIGGKSSTNKPAGVVGGDDSDAITPESLINQCHQVITAPATRQDQERALLLAAVKRGQQLREERMRRHRQQFPLESRLEEQLVGQQVAIQAVSSAVRRKENGWIDEDSPLVMLFMGSSGIGKTRTAKLIGEYLHAGEDKEKLSNCFIRIDMSEFQHKHEVSKFIGAPPGYVGYEAGGQLVTKLEKCPNAVVLLDEVEKAHPDVLTVMLQAFDEGRLTDGQGKTVNCADSIFILTSNLAQREIADEAVRLRRVAASKAARTDADADATSLDGTVDPLTKSFKRNVVQPILRKHFGRDEFLGRINEILFFLPFTEDEQRQLARKELEAWRQRAAKKMNINLSWTPAVEQIAAEEYDLRYGARSIKYEIDRMCIAPIARAQEQGALGPGYNVHVDVDWQQIHRIRQVAASGDASRIEDSAKQLQTAISTSSGNKPFLPTALGGDGSAEARLAAERKIVADYIDEKAKQGAERSRQAAAGPMPDPPTPLPGATLIRSGKVALSVSKKKDDASAGSSNGDGVLKRLFSFGGSDDKATSGNNKH